MIVIVDFLMSNLGSVVNMLKKIGVNATVSSNPSVIDKADKLILPGVGAFDNAIKNLENLGVVHSLNARVVQDKIPILGICLGSQLFAKRSEEGSLPGLGWIDAEVVRFKFDNHSNLKIPHMGWNTIKATQECPIFQDMYEDARFYFVHSYHFICNSEMNILTTSYYGYEFPSSIIKENIIGTQFHPEKSHKFGMKLFKNFVESF